MSGEGACFPFSTGICPPPSRHRLVCGIRPTRNRGQRDDPYGDDGSRFAGATFDPSGVYRLGAVLAWLDSEGATPSRIHEHALSLQGRFLSRPPSLGDLLVGDATERGNFLTFRSDRAGVIYEQLHERGVITDFRPTGFASGSGSIKMKKTSTGCSTAKVDISLERQPRPTGVCLPEAVTARPTQYRSRTEGGPRAKLAGNQAGTTATHSNSTLALGSNRSATPIRAIGGNACRTPGDIPPRSGRDCRGTRHVRRVDRHRDQVGRVPTRLR